MSASIHRSFFFPLASFRPLVLFLRFSENSSKGVHPSTLSRWLRKEEEEKIDRKKKKKKRGTGGLHTPRVSKTTNNCYPFDVIATFNLARLTSRSEQYRRIVPETFIVYSRDCEFRAANNGIARDRYTLNNFFLLSIGNGNGVRKRSSFRNCAPMPLSFELRRNNRVPNQYLETLRVLPFRWAVVSKFNTLLQSLSKNALLWNKCACCAIVVSRLRDFPEAKYA